MPKISDNEASDKIILNDAQYMCRIGTTDAERAFPQRISLDLSVSCDTRKAAKSRELKDSVCWATLNRICQTVIATKEWVLAEELGEALCGSIFKEFVAAQAISLRLKKYPFANAGWVGVEISRSR